MTRRRLLLSSAAGIATALAGCSSGPSSSGSSDTPSPTGGGFRSVRTEGTALVAELGETTLDSVSVVAPDGTSFADEPVQAGVSTVEIPLGTEYEPGEFQILGVADGESVAEARLEIRPELEIVEVGVGANHLDRMPETLEASGEQALVEVRNTGTGPGEIAELRFSGDVPNPTDDLSDTGDSRSGLFDSEEGYGESDGIVVPARETVTAYSTTLPFLFAGDGIRCTDTNQTGTMVTSIRSLPYDSDITSRYRVSYSGSSSSEGCRSEVSGEVE
jgi:hypothetical protein